MGFRLTHRQSKHHIIRLKFTRVVLIPGTVNIAETWCTTDAHALRFKIGHSLGKGFGKPVIRSYMFDAWASVAEIFSMLGAWFATSSRSLISF